MTRSALVVLLVFGPLLVASAGCSDSFVADAGSDGSTDLGMDGGSRDLGRDTGPPDFGLRDLGTYDGPEDCSEIAGYRRCDERCPRPCDSPDRCWEQTGLCVGPAEVGGCGFTALSEDYATYCGQGGPCAVYRGDGSTATPWIGACFGADVCLASEGAGLPEFTCRYSDGSVVVTGPPAGTCPPSSEGAAFCGGACGMAPEGCPDTDGIIGRNTANPCIGLSDSRAFGVCTYWNFNCATVVTRFGLEQLAYAHDLCRENYGAPCACMQIEAGPDGPMSYFVKADACLRYRAAYPDSVECLDVTEMPIP